MSGKPIKKKSEQVGQAAPAEVNAPEAPVITPTVTGHYQPVTQSSAPPQPDSAAPELTGSDTIVTLNVSGSQMDTEQVNQDQVTLTDVLAQEYADKPAGVESSAPPQPDSAAPELTGSDTIVTLNVSGSQMDTEQVNQDQVTLTDVLAQEYADKPAGVEVLLVQAISLNGFYRAGQFWPHEGVHAFVSYDADSDTTENEANMVAPFISIATAERLKAEPNLRVTVVETVVTDAEGE